MAAKPVEYNATITRKTLLTESLAIFRVVPDEPAPTFIPGQYAILGLNHAEKGSVMRAYSIASPPHTHADYLEFYIRYVKQPTSDNPLTHLLFATNEGDRIMMRNKLQGHFTVEKCMGESDPRLRVLVAAGTGLAPFTSIVFEQHHRHGNIGNNAILHGASYPVDLGYKDELNAIMNTGEHPRYLCSVSRPHEVDKWDGLTGRVESHFQPDRIGFLEQKLGLAEGGFNPQNVTVMICGLTGTIATSIMNLFHRGFIPGDKRMRREFGIPESMAASVFYEQYDTEPVIDYKDETLMGELAERLRKAGVALEKKVVAGT